MLLLFILGYFSERNVLDLFLFEAHLQRAKAAQVCDLGDHGPVAQHARTGRSELRGPCASKDLVPGPGDFGALAPVTLCTFSVNQHHLRFKLLDTSPTNAPHLRHHGLVKAGRTAKAPGLCFVAHKGCASAWSGHAWTNC